MLGTKNLEARVPRLVRAGLVLKAEKATWGLEEEVDQGIATQVGGLFKVQIL